MGNIPLVTNREPVRVGPPQSRATAEEFGAGIGRATQQLGQTIAQVGAQIGSKFESIQAHNDQLATANAVAGFDYTQTYNDSLLAAPADGSGLYEGTQAGYAQSVDEYLAGLNLTPKQYEAAKARLMNEGGTFAAKAANDAFKMKIGSSKIDSDQALSTQLNTISQDITQYDASVKKGLDVIDAQVMTAAEKEERKIIYKSQAAEAYFQAGMNAAKTPEDIATLQKQLGEDKWKGELREDRYTIVSNALASASKQYDSAIRAQLTSSIADMKGRLSSPDPSNSITKEELAALGAQVQQYGDENQKRDWASIVVTDKTFKENIALPPSQIRGNIAGYQHAGTYGQGNPEFAPIPKPGSGMAADPRQMQLRPDVLNGVTVAGEKLGQRFILTSGNRGYLVTYRGQTMTYNDYIKVSGRSPGAAWNSQHEHGNAIDYEVSQWDDATRGKAIRALRESGFTYFKFYNDGHVHADMRGGALAASDTGYATPSEKAALGASISVPGGGMRASTAPQPGGKMSRVPGNVRPTIEATANRYGIPPGLLAAVWLRESGGTLHPGRSSAGAMGPFQFMPETAKRFGLTNPDDFNAAADASARYLQILIQRYNGDIVTAAGAYNFGEGNMDEYLAGKRSLPKETRDYMAFIAQQTGASGTALQRAEQPGYGLGTATRVSAADKTLSYQETQLNNNMIQYAQDLNSPALPALTPLTDAASFSDRGQDAEFLAEFFEMDPDKIKPFSAEEAAKFAQIMNSDDVDGKIDLMASINAMNPNMRQYALKQVGETDPVFAYAGGTYGRDGGRTARDIVQGLDRLKGANGDAIMKANGNKDALYEQFLKNLSASASALNPNQVEAAFAATNALMAQRNRQAPTTAWDEDAYAQAINDVLGVTPQDVNGFTVLLPNNVAPDDLNTIIEGGSIQDWAELSADKTPPFDPATGQPVPVDILADEARLYAIDDRGGYAVALADNRQLVTANIDANGQAQAYIMVLDPNDIKLRAAKIRDQQTAVEGAATTAGTGYPDIWGGNTPPAGFQGGEITPAAPVGTTRSAAPQPVVKQPPSKAVLDAYDRDVTKQLKTIETELRKNLKAQGIAGKALEDIVAEQLAARNAEYASQREQLGQ